MMRYIRMYMGSEDGAPGLTLYEIDATGWVHRQVQIHADGSRFSPEDILMRRPVNTDYMAIHAASEEIDKREFEMLWAEVNDGRAFCERIPDPGQAWEGWMEHREAPKELRWIPTGHAIPGAGWMKVPGFVRLYLRADDDDQPWAAQRDVFLERSIHWRALEHSHAA